MSNVVRTLASSDGRRKVEIYRRDDGTYGFEAFTYGDELREHCWVVSGRYSYCIVPDADAAEQEARQRVSWPTRLSRE